MMAIVAILLNGCSVSSAEEIDYLGDKNVQPAIADILTGRNRDSQMAENINWIMENYPDEKLIVWCANLHAAKDISQTRYPTDSLLYFNFQSTGEALYTRHGNKMYCLAFTSLGKEEENGALEKAIVDITNNAPYAFVDFESLRFADGYRDKAFESNVIGKKQGKWLYIFDGIYYIRDERRN